MQSQASAETLTSDQGRIQDFVRVGAGGGNPSRAPFPRFSAHVQKLGERVIGDTPFNVAASQRSEASAPPFSY